nr:cinnamoyl-CoA reductase-like SNL6 isoform X1 [Lolium perenne]
MYILAARGCIPAVSSTSLRRIVAASVTSFVGRPHPHGVAHLSPYIPAASAIKSLDFFSIEAKAAEQVVKVCMRTQSIGKCIFSSSLLPVCGGRTALVTVDSSKSTIDEGCWSVATFLPRQQGYGQEKRK